MLGSDLARAGQHGLRLPIDETSVANRKPWKRCPLAVDRAIGRDAQRCLLDRERALTRRGSTIPVCAVKARSL
jgi:hypothetical protein